MVLSVSVELAVNCQSVLVLCRGVSMRSPLFSVSCVLGVALVAVTFCVTTAYTDITSWRLGCTTFVSFIGVMVIHMIYTDNRKSVDGRDTEG